MRVLAWILLGLAIGAVASVSALNAINARNAVPHGVMSLLGYHMGHARNAVTGDVCPSDVRHHFEAIAVLARDVDATLQAPGEKDEQFSRYAADLVAAADAARAIEGNDCAAFKEPFSTLGGTCQACHRDYK